MKQKIHLLAAATALIVVASSTAQAAAPVPKSAEPSRVQQQIAPMTPTLKSDDAAGASSHGAVQAPSGAEKATFKFSNLKVDGATVYSDEEILPLYKDKVGQTISLADVYDLASKLTAKYRNDGYILSQVVVPPQEISGGEVRLRVVEGFVHDIRIEGTTGGRIDELYPYIEKIRAAKPFSSKVLERYLLLINDLPGISAKSVLSPSKVAGATDVVLIVQRKAYDGYVQVDNRGTRYLGPLQVNTGVRLNNMFGTYEGINLQYATAPFENELAFGAISLTEPIGHEGTKITLGGSATRTRPGFLLTPFSVKGTSRTVSAEISHPFIRSRNENLSTAFRIDHLDSDRTDNTTVFPIRDIVTAARLSALYQLVDRHAGANSLAVELSRGLDIFGSTGPSNVSTTRPGAENEFVKCTIDVSRLQRVTDMFDIFVSGTGQIASHRLLTSEQFGLGGVSFGSAYDPSEITGDDGVAGRAELRLNSPETIGIDAVQFYTFFDAGRVWDAGNAVVADRNASLSSAGGGFRLTVNDSISGTFEAAQPLGRNVATQNGKAMRFFGSLTAKF